MPPATGTALALFNDFQKTTPERFLQRHRGRIKNEAQRHSYQFLRRMMFNRDVQEMVSFGSLIKFDIMFDARNTAQFYKPGASANWSNPQVLSEAKIPHRYIFDHKSWTSQEVEYNTNGMTTEAQDAFFIQHTRKLEQRMITSLLNTIEAHAWSPAHGQSGAMESDVVASPSGDPEEGLLPYSIHALINEHTNGLADGWTTVQRLDPTKFGDKYVPPVVEYDATDALDLDGDGDGLEQAFDEMYDDLRFELPGKYDEHFEQSTGSPNSYQNQSVGPRGHDGYGDDTDGYSPHKQIIAASKQGRLQYRQVLYGRNDRTYSATSLGVPEITYGGVPIVRVEDLESNEYYAKTGGGFTFEGDADAVATGPRYWWLNLNEFVLEFHPSRYFYLHNVREAYDQMDAWVQPISCWYNSGVTSRRRGGGIIKPQ